MAAYTLRPLHPPLLGAALVACAGALVVGLDAQPQRLRSASGEAGVALESGEGDRWIGQARQATGLVGAREAPAPAAENPAFEREVVDLRLPGALPRLAMPVEPARTAREESQALIEELACAFEHAVAILSAMPLDFQGDPELAAQEAEALRALNVAIQRTKQRAKALEGQLSSSDEAALSVHAGERLGPLLEKLAGLHPAAMQRLSRTLSEDDDAAPTPGAAPHVGDPASMEGAGSSPVEPAIEGTAEGFALR